MLVKETSKIPAVYTLSKIPGLQWEAGKGFSFSEGTFFDAELMANLEKLIAGASIEQIKSYFKVEGELTREDLMKALWLDQLLPWFNTQNLPRVKVKGSKNVYMARELYLAEYARRSHIMGLI